ncbi:MAG: shikimate kinase [Corynebacterium sp.]|nr:shikimate kinase [Corynebacterium sp.]
MPANKPALILVGMPGSGKTTIGQAVAAARNIPFLDSDHRIAAEYGKACGEVFAEVGEHRFREIEQNIIAALLGETGVVSLGGGAVITPATRKRLANHHVVWLHVSPEVGVARSLRDGGRPLLAGTDPYRVYTKLYNERQDFFAEVATHILHTSDLNEAEVIAQVQELIAAHDAEGS